MSRAPAILLFTLVCFGTWCTAQVQPGPIPPPPPPDAPATPPPTAVQVPPTQVQQQPTFIQQPAVTPVAITQPATASVTTSQPKAIVPAIAKQFANGFAITSPFNNNVQNRRLLDTLRLRVQLANGYAASSSPACTLAGTSSIEVTYCLAREIDKKTRVLELAVAWLPTRERQIIVYGVEVGAKGESSTNPDLASLQLDLQTEISNLGSRAPASVDLDHLSSQFYDLSYTEGDRAIGLLKALGYTTVEYRADSGESLYDKIYSPIKTGDKAPIIVKVVSPSKTSLMEPNPQTSLLPGQFAQPILQQQAATSSAVPEIGGTFLHHSTQGEPAERLLILYEPDDVESLQKVLDLLRDQIDVPARQVIIEAQVIEINTDRSRDLGFSFSGSQSGVDISNGGVDTNGQPLPFVLSFDKNAISISSFKAQLTALVQRGEAELLSNPSVLVLDGRQARIQIGQQVPVVKSVSTQAGIISSVDYFPVGIVLNLRPHISDDGSDITMQTETIVSAIAQASSNTSSSAQVFLAPVVDNRQVQSFIRVSDNTPFIIGGLISTNERKNTSGVPYLSDVPVLGNLFKRVQTTKTKQEVIIVVTPHVVPIKDKYLSYVIPKDSPALDRFNYTLFRNAYRVRAGDLFDLQFITQSKAVSELRTRVERDAAANVQLRAAEPVASILKGSIPGEDIFVRRMLWEIIQKTGFSSKVATDRIIFFSERADSPDGSGYQLAFLKDKLKLPSGSNALSLTFEANPKTSMERPFVPPIASVGFEDITSESFASRLSAGNARGPSGERKNNQVLLSDKYSGVRVAPLDVLKGVLVLKRVLELNRSMPLTISEFHVGRQVVFPTDEDLEQHYHIIDRETAQFFYEIVSYYPAFEQEFSYETKRAEVLLDQVEK